MDIDEAYQTLQKEIHDYYVLTQIKNILDWDFETYIPPKGVKQRSEEMMVLATLIHDSIANPKIGKLLNVIKNDLNYSSLDKKSEGRLF